MGNQNQDKSNQANTNNTTAAASGQAAPQQGNAAASNNAGSNTGANSTTTTANNSANAGNNTAAGTGTAVGGNTSTNTATQAPTNGADDMLKLMDQNQKTCMLGQWMKCLRKPALSMQYTLSKKHIPDMDNDPAGQTPVQGSNSDTMSVTGGFTIRYFDFAAGALTLMIAGCIMKGCCCLKKLM